MVQIRHREIWGKGGYSDVYYDAYVEYADAVYIENRKHNKIFRPDHHLISSIFEPDAELEEFPDIWVAIAGVWDGPYATLADRVAAVDAALAAAGYTGPGGAAL